MFRVAGLGAAVANAPSEVKEADHVSRYQSANMFC